MVERVLEQEPAIQHVLGPDRRCLHLIATWQDVEALQSIHACLSPLADFTDMLSGKEHITASAFKPLWNVLWNEVLVASVTDTTLVAHIQERICNYLESKYLRHSNFEDTIKIVSFLDPRFKAQYLGDELPLIKHCVIRVGVELLGSQGINEDVQTYKSNSTTVCSHWECRQLSLNNFCCIHHVITNYISTWSPSNATSIITKSASIGP